MGRKESGSNSSGARLNTWEQIAGWKRKAERQYRVTDYWLSHESFEDFRQRYQLEYEKFSRLIASDGLVERETLLGSFYRGDSDLDEGIDLVPS